MTVIGALDEFTHSRLRGWAQDLLAPDRILTVELVNDGVVVAKTEADIGRPDIGESAAGPALCGFDLTAPRHAALGRLTVRVADSDFDFGGQALEPRPAYRTKFGDFDRSETLAARKDYIGADKPRLLTFSSVLQRAHKAAEEGRTVMVLPPFIDWNVPLFQRPQHIALAAANLGHEFIYFTSRMNHDWLGENVLLRQGLTVCKDADRFEEFLRAAPPCFIHVYSTAWGFTEEHIRGWRNLGHYIVYEYVDHIDPAISGEGANAAMELFSSLSTDLVDLVVPTAQLLNDELAPRFPSDKMIAMAPNGVEIDRFTAIAETHPKIAEIRERNPDKPIVGYVGALATWIDFDLVRDLANHRPDIQFVMVGPVYDARVKPSTAPNIEYTGPIPYTEVPAMLRGFDVCWIPFKEGDIARTTSPLKLFEYFAAEKPVVVNHEMRECTAFEEVFTGRDVESYSQAVTAALEARSDMRHLARLRAHADKASWTNRARTMIDAMGEIEDLRVDLLRRTPIPASLWRVTTGSIERPDGQAPCTLDPSGSKLTARRDEAICRSGDFLRVSLDLSAVRVEPELENSAIRLVLQALNDPPENYCGVTLRAGGRDVAFGDMSLLRQGCEIWLSAEIARAGPVEIVLLTHHTDYAGACWWHRFELVIADASFCPLSLDRRVVASHPGMIVSPDLIAPPSERSGQPAQRLTDAAE